MISHTHFHFHYLSLSLLFVVERAQGLPHHVVVIELRFTHDNRNIVAPSSLPDNIPRPSSFVPHSQRTTVETMRRTLATRKAATGLPQDWQNVFLCRNSDPVTCSVFARSLERSSNHHPQSGSIDRKDGEGYTRCVRALKQSLKVRGDVGAAEHHTEELDDSSLDCNQRSTVARQVERDESFLINTGLSSVLSTANSCVESKGGDLPPNADKATPLWLQVALHDAVLLSPRAPRRTMEELMAAASVSVDDFSDDTLCLLMKESCERLVNSMANATLEFNERYTNSAVSAFMAQRNGHVQGAGYGALYVQRAAVSQTLVHGSFIADYIIRSNRLGNAKLARWLLCYYGYSGQADKALLVLAKLKESLPNGALLRNDVLSAMLAASLQERFDVCETIIEGYGDVLLLGTRGGSGEIATAASILHPSLFPFVAKAAGGNAVFVDRVCRLFTSLIFETDVGSTADVTMQRDISLAACAVFTAIARASAVAESRTDALQEGERIFRLLRDRTSAAIFEHQAVSEGLMHLCARCNAESRASVMLKRVVDKQGKKELSSLALANAFAVECEIDVNNAVERLEHFVNLGNRVTGSSVNVIMSGLMAARSSQWMARVASLQALAVEQEIANDQGPAVYATAVLLFMEDLLSRSALSHETLDEAVRELLAVLQRHAASHHLRSVCPVTLTVLQRIRLMGWFLARSHEVPLLAPSAAMTALDAFLLQYSTGHVTLPERQRYSITLRSLGSFVNGDCTLVLAHDGQLGEVAKYCSSCEFDAVKAHHALEAVSASAEVAVGSRCSPLVLLLDQYILLKDIRSAILAREPSLAVHYGMAPSRGSGESSVVLVLFKGPLAVADALLSAYLRGNLKSSEVQRVFWADHSTAFPKDVEKPSRSEAIDRNEQSTNGSLAVRLPPLAPLRDFIVPPTAFESQLAWLHGGIEKTFVDSSPFIVA